MNAFLCPAPVQQWLMWRILRWFFRATFSWRTARCLLLAVAALATLFALFYAVENWRGRRAWQQVQREMQARGESLELAAFVPPPVPDEENFAMAPIWRPLLETWSSSPSPNPQWFAVWSSWSRAKPEPRGDWQKAERVDLARWQQYYRELHTEAAAHGEKTPGLTAFPISLQPGTPAEDVLLALSRYDENLAALRSAARRPRSRFPVRYEDRWAITVPHLGILQSASALLRLRAVAELRLERTDLAMADVQLHFRLIETIQAEPSFISHVVRVSMWQMLLPGIWEGAADLRWGGPQLLALEGELRKLDFLSGYELSGRAEVAAILETFDQLKTTRDLELFSSVFGAGRQTWAPVFRWMPRGWFDRNKVACVRFHQEMSLPRAEASARHVASEEWRQRKSRSDSAGEGRRPYSFLAAQMTSSQQVAWMFIKAEALVRLARTACALERYCLAHGSYPDTLGALAPQFVTAVPRDVIDGGELKSRRTDDGRFVLYSLGWNGKDDGGNVALLRGKTHLDPKEGDWVWRYPAE